MRKVLLLSVLFMFVGLVANAQAIKDVEAPPASKAKMMFGDGNSDTTLDYGTIEKGADPLRKVVFKNEGTEPLVISNARGSCGCTVPTWPKEPVLPGQTSAIEVRYDTNRVGKFTKTVTITTNEGKEHFIRVQGEVFEKKQDAPVPASAPSVIKGGK